MPPKVFGGLCPCLKTARDGPEYDRKFMVVMAKVRTHTLMQSYTMHLLLTLSYTMYRIHSLTHTLHITMIMAVMPRSLFIHSFTHTQCTSFTLLHTLSTPSLNTPFRPLSQISAVVFLSQAVVIESKGERQNMSSMHFTDYANRLYTLHTGHHHYSASLSYSMYP